MTTAALKKGETKHIGRKLFQYLYKILLITGLLTELVKWEKGNEQKIQHIKDLSLYCRKDN